MQILWLENLIYETMLLLHSLHAQISQKKKIKANLKSSLLFEFVKIKNLAVTIHYS